MDKEGFCNLDESNKKEALYIGCSKKYYKKVVLWLTVPIFSTVGHFVHIKGKVGHMTNYDNPR